MNILVFIEIYDKGGIDTFVSNLINNWPNANDSFTILHNKKYLGIINIKKRLNKKISFHTYCEASSTFYTRLFNTFHFLNKIIYLIAVLKPIKYDLLMIVNGGYPGGDFCRASIFSSKWNNAKIKIIHNIHNLAQKKTFFNFLSELTIDYFLSKFTDLVITVSNNSLISFDLSSRLQGLKKKFIYNGIDESLVSKKIDKNLIKRLKIPIDNNIILMLATYEPRKGHELLFKAFQKLLLINKQTTLLICGYGTKNEKKNIHDLINLYSLENNIITSNFVSDINTLINISDVLVLPSIRDESFGYVLIEAMQRKKPVIGTNIGGINEVILHKNNGFIVDTNDHESLTKYLSNIISDKNLSKRMGNNGYKIYREKFTAKLMAKNYEELINKIL